MSRHADALDSASSAFEAAKNALCDVAVNYAAEECRALSLRYPGRRVTWSCGNGRAWLEIERRRPLNRGDFAERAVFIFGGGYRDPMPFMAHLDALEDEHRIPGLATGSFTFLNGQELDY